MTAVLRLKLRLTLVIAMILWVLVLDDGVYINCYVTCARRNLTPAVGSCSIPSSI
eukprot:gene10274-2422_t